MSVCMSGTRGSGVLSSTCDVLVRGVGGVCDMGMCLTRGGVGEEGGEWMRELGLGFTNPVRTGGVWQSHRIEHWVYLRCTYLAVKMREISSYRRST